ncbi:MAG: alpha/beta fold hydrolase [Acidobacteriota bacterium]|nr:alpha/beta fold hydrolase [Acidobacteriota bacterium]
MRVSRVACALAVALARAQQSQNPSPMVEHTRAHLRITEQTPPGRREKLDIGTLFIPARVRPTTLLIFFHGGTWLPEVAAARDRIAVLTVQAGNGSGTYARLFTDPARFPALLLEAERKAHLKFPRVILGGWSAGCGAVRQILRAPAAYARTSAILLIDGVHTDYESGGPGPLESSLDGGNLEVWVRFFQDAIARRKAAILTHSEIFPGTYASTTETTDYLVRELHLNMRAVLKWGPMGTQQLSEARAGRLLILGFAGNSAPDHVDQLHSLPAYLKMLR